MALASAADGAGRVRSPRLTLSVGVNLSLVPVLAGLVMLSGATAPLRPAAFVDRADYETAVSSFEDKQTPLFETLTPAPSLAAADVGEIYDRGCVNDPRDDEVQLCLAGDPDGQIVVAAVGDSKVAQWMPALQTIAEDHGWRLEIYLKSGCPLTSAVALDVSGETYDTCTDWGRVVLDRLLAHPRS
ncbi:MAG: hypothetical protein H0U62_12180 [Actinobacteria bacterium]|nr:hypothetical protein [Actinomycetota bacterium]